MVFGLSATSLSAILAACGSNRRPRRLGGAAHRGRGSGRADLGPVRGPHGERPGLTAKLNMGLEGDADTVDPQAFKTVPGYYMMANLYDQLIDLQARAAVGTAC